jgi:hypothetical protein
MSAEGILKLLKELYERGGGIEACMVARRGLEGVVMFPESFKKDVGPVWEPLARILDDMLYVIERDSVFTMSKAYVEALGFGMAFYVLGGSDNALIVFVKDKKNSFDKLRAAEGEAIKTLGRLMKTLA